MPNTKLSEFLSLDPTEEASIIEAFTFVKDSLDEWYASGFEKAVAPRARGALEKFIDVASHYKIKELKTLRSTVLVLLKAFNSTMSSADSVRIGKCYPEFLEVSTSLMRAFTQIQKVFPSKHSSGPLARLYLPDLSNKQNAITLI